MKWRPLWDDSMNIVTIATYSTNTRWFIPAMATMMMALISSSYGYNEAAPYLFIAGIAAFFSVAVFITIKSVFFYSEFLHDIYSPEKTNYLFSVVGVIGLAGVFCSKLWDNLTVPWIFWYVSLILWVIITLLSFSFLFLSRKSEDRKLEEVLHGGWFFVCIGTQATALMSIIVAKQATSHLFLIHLISFGLWSIGAFLYLLFMTLIVLRLIFYSFPNNSELSPYWMHAGAAALTALTGVTLFQHISATGGPFLDLLPFLKGFSLFFWSVGLWWLPLLSIMALKKQAYDDNRFVFTVGYWEIALSLALYAAGTKQLTGIFAGQYIVVFSHFLHIAVLLVYGYSLVSTITHLAFSSVWTPVNDLTISCVVPYRFTLRGKIFYVTGIVSEWMDKNIQGKVKKQYYAIVNNNLTCLISYDLFSKKWYIRLANAAIDTKGQPPV